jgi:origin recognition complex subunit 5
VIAGRFTREQTTKLYTSINASIKKLLHSLYLRDISSSEWEHRLQNGVKVVNSVGKLRLITGRIELPRYTKYLLIASFIGTYMLNQLPTTLLGWILASSLKPKNSVRNFDN